MDWKKECSGENMKVICQNEKCTVIKIEDETGDGMMTLYPVFEGCYVIYNDFHMEKVKSAFNPSVEMFCIDHCREGRIEWKSKNNSYAYVSAGDMQVDCRGKHTDGFFFPLCHYHGMTIVIEMDSTEDGVLNLMDDFSIDLNKLKEKFCPVDKHFIMRAGSKIDRIFSELYDLPEEVRNIYIKIKIMELLLFLDTLEVPNVVEERNYYYKSQVDKIKAIVKLQIEDLSVNYTLDELSKKFDFPLTSMKQCFKGIYGCSMADYMKNYRMNVAAELLLNSDKPVIEIASSLGYENPGKFSAAFKSKQGMTPSEYRKNLDRPI